MACSYQVQQLLLLLLLLLGVVWATVRAILSVPAGSSTKALQLQEREERGGALKGIQGLVLPHHLRVWWIQPAAHRQGFH
jgi:hypothetical protein